MARIINRRNFLSGATAAGVGLTILKDSRSVWSAPANEKLHAALIGVGGRGSWFVNTIPNLCNVVAFCDCNEKKATRAIEKFTVAPYNLKLHHDYREMFDSMADKIDVVFIATPDHHHGPATCHALEHGVGVFVEKPMTRTVGEARRVRALAKKHKVATQMGNQGTASPVHRRGVELIQAGKIGEVKEVHVWKDGGGDNRQAPPAEAQTIPDYLDWNLWLGPAAMRPFHPLWMGWHGWRDFGTSQLGNWGSHSANLAFRALKLDTLWHADPKTKPRIRIQSKVSSINRLSFPKWEVIDFHFPARGDLAPVTITWHSGPAPGLRDRIEGLMGDGLDFGDKKEKKWADHAGTLVVGSEGMIQSNGHNTVQRLLPEDKFKGVDVLRPEKLPRSRGHENEFLDAVKGGPPAWSNFDYSGPLNEFLQLGNVATQFESELIYDPLAGKIVNNQEANKALNDIHRPGWLL